MFRKPCLVLTALGAVALLAGCGSAGTPVAQSTTATATRSSAPGTTTQSPAGTTAPAAGTGAECKPDPAVIRNAAATLAPVDGTGHQPWKWALPAVGANPTINGICSGLSAALITVEGATGSSPMQVLLFHRGGYIGTAEPTWNAFISPDPTHATDDSVGLRYKIPGSCNACPDATYYCVQYRWDGAKVVATGRPPRITGATTEPGSTRC
ncbi:LppP/LprE family lipoprotein [Nocardia seriolae]|uniref:LppP/LprE family lipoprotein n=1 Tax=Nocardia seriolae TaxID=37332 RepID=A0ABC9Z1G0_9NOCA|nr:LppP/LprE family lipoprotein [Nocardia seriolae]APA97554.1 hypothetical protein NS506_03502 [Nocardia seriolae]OJF81504.1 hypothetical protein NS14008_22890 [Nocardia seriolae]PSK28438.1 hypothetical protein C6575_26490 [Nocardia seriolae]QOW34487.1 LppP/LprE family lipoprotein [Nocardia seriolae]QUN18054.1 LppP/LprE family lipoprotein [Nocardia seriolae]